ncbi:MAG: Omp28-related outer membrane protein, partial [Lentimicrobiaceae bacterium]|nr:Omp28-related outer membrane protein [Lentimicrobiaceae bacterium]
MDSLILAGHKVAVINNHGGDTYENVYSAARNSYYSLSAYPTAKFDGVGSFAGGYPCPEPYGNYGVYLPFVNDRMAVASPVVISTEFSPVGVYDYQLVVHVTKVGAIESTNLKLRVAVTESHVAQTWQCLEEVSQVNRLMVPDADGTPISFATGDEVTVNLNFAVDPSWNKENLELIVFVQNDTSKEVLQTIKAPFPLFSRDAMLLNMEDITTANCTGVLQPSFTLANNGAEPLTSITINYQINNDPLVSYEWTGNIPYMSSEIIQMDPIAFTPDGNNSFLLYGTNPNGNNDQNFLNDTLLVSFPDGYVCSTYKVALTLLTDDNPGETTYGVINSSGEMIAAGGPFDAANTIVRDTFELLSTDCYKFIMYDEGCDGLTGGGYYQLKEAKSGG